MLVGNLLKLRKPPAQKNKEHGSDVDARRQNWVAHRTPWLSYAQVASNLRVAGDRHGT